MNKPINTDDIVADVLIVGAGLVGLAAAIALTLQHKNVVLVTDKSLFSNEKNKFKPHVWDERVYAVTPATETWLKALGVWAYIDENRLSMIDAMRLWGANSDVLLRASDANLAKLGLIIEDQNLMAALWQCVHALGVTVITDTQCVHMKQSATDVTLGLKNHASVVAKLIVAADGSNSWVRRQANIAVKQKKYNQTAVVANFLIEKPHHNEAKQWFEQHDTLALLPLPQQQVSMVWSVSTEKAAQLLALSSGALCDAVYTQSQGLLGVLKQAGNVKSAELSQQTAIQLIAERIVLVGDSAHQIHPMAGQGVNLGFRDVMKLTELTTKLHALHDIGDHAFLRQYERARKADIVAMNTLTMGLDYLFASEQQLLKSLTHWGIKQIKQQSSIRKLLIQQATN